MCLVKGQRPLPRNLDNNPAPAGVAATDYGCVDFDTGLPPENKWERIESDGHALTTTETKAKSPPASLLLDPASTNNFDEFLQWTSVGGDPITSVTLTFELNPKSFGGPQPAWSGDITIAEFRLGIGSVSLRYTHGG